MNKEELFKAFQELFPDWAAHVHSYKKIGSKVLAIEFGFKDKSETERISRVFLYDSQNNWQFGTKLWRKRPEKTKKKSKKEVKKDEVQLVGESK